MESLLEEILSKDSLFRPGMVFAMECTLLYKNVRVILVHDVESCFFPGEDQQPENVRSLFQEKAITHLAGNPLKVQVI